MPYPVWKSCRIEFRILPNVSEPTEQDITAANNFELS